MTRNTLEACLFDGESSRAETITVALLATGELLIAGSDRHDGIYPHDGLTISPRVGHIERRIQLPGGAVCVVKDNDAVDAFLATARPGSLTGLWHRLESRTPWVVASLGFIGLMIWVALVWGVPLVAEYAAKGIPVKIDSWIGEQTLQKLQKVPGLFSPSQTYRGREQQLTRQVNAMVSAAARDGVDFQGLVFVVHLYDSKKIGANALTLPGGILLVTDALLKLLNEEQLTAVMAHELGHAFHRHGLRMVLQTSATSVLMSLLAGDTGIFVYLATALPATLLNLSYARQFEEDADQFAAGILQRQGISPRLLAEALTVLEKGQEHMETPAYLSTHPRTAQRIQTLNMQD